MIRQMAAAFFATMGFGVIFSVRGRKLVFASLGASLGSMAAYLCMQAGWHYFMVQFMTAMVVSLYAEVMARYLKTPVTVLLISEIICFVPGGLMYQTMEEFMKGNHQASLQYGIEALGTAAALALGIMIAASLFRLYLYFIHRMQKG